MWQYAVSTNLENYPVITDLDGDGDIEVIGNQYILDGATGALVAVLSGASGNWGAPAVADLDLDGFQEIMLENRVYNYDGSFRFACGAGGVGTFPHPVNIDADNLGEVMIAAPSRVTVCDDDGSTLWSRAHTSYGTATAIADFDNDGMQEFAFANYGSITLLEGDGSTRWSTSVSDYSGLAGTTSWDIDLDGVPEVIYADENDILVLNGATGAVVTRNPSHGSVTLAETPAVADVDGDGQGELIYGSNDFSYKGITVFGSADGDWPYSRPVYNQATYYGANINDDLSVPTNPDPPWIHPANIFRGQPSAIYVAARPNLRAEISDVCIASCEPGGQAMVWLQVWNDGAGDVAPGAVLDLYGNPGGSRTLVASTTLTDPVPAQGSVEVLIETTHELLGDGLEAVIDGAEVLTECHEDDNTDTMAIEPCNP